MKKYTNPDREWEEKPRKVIKGTDKASKHRKSIYNMLSEYEDDYSGFDSDDSDVDDHYDNKQR